VTKPSRWLEDAIVLVVAFAATLQAEWTIVLQPRVYQTDAMIHEFWMRRFQDSGLFDDPLTISLLDTGYSPPAFRSLFWLASHVVDPPPGSLARSSSSPGTSSASAAATRALSPSRSSS
jgi:hypothetical protein